LEHGMRMINLPEVLIKGIRNKDTSIWDLPPVYSFSSEEIAKSGAPYISYFLRKVPIFKNSIKNSILGVNIDGMGIPLDIESVLAMVDIEEVRQINIYNVYENNRYIGKSITIYTKRGIWNTSPSFNIKPAIPLGYQLPVEFYSPKYDTQEKIDDSKPDLRTTIYWQPNVITDDKGNAKLDFYTADDPGTYSVIIEGVSEDGRLIHYRGESVIAVE